MRLTWALIALMLALLLGCQKIRYEYLDFTDVSFQLNNTTGLIVLRGEFGEEIDGAVLKASPYALLASFPLSPSNSVSEADWSLEKLILTTTKRNKPISIPIDRVPGELAGVNTGEKRIYFKVYGLNLPHEQIQVRFTLIGPDGLSAPIEVIFDPILTIDERSPFIDRIMSV